MGAGHIVRPRVIFGRIKAVGIRSHLYNNGVDGARTEVVENLFHTSGEIGFVPLASIDFVDAEHVKLGQPAGFHCTVIERCIAARIRCGGRARCRTGRGMTAGCGFAFGIRGGVAASRFVSGRANGTGCAARTIGGFTGCAGTVDVASGTVVRHKRVREAFLQRREIRPASAYQQDNAKDDSGQL